MGSFSSSHSLSQHHSSLYHHLSLYLLSLHLSFRISLVVVVKLVCFQYLQERDTLIKIPARMRNPKMIMKQEFIRIWTLALKTCYQDSSKYSSVMEKQKAIKQTAAIAMAAAKQGSTAWSRAILVNEYEQMNNEVIHFQYPVKLKHLCVKSAHPTSSTKRKFTRSKRVIRCTKRFMSMDRKARSVAKSIINEQTQVLKRLIPGGEKIDECCLIGEALDYIVSLKAQVDVMKELVVEAEYMKKP